MGTLVMVGQLILSLSILIVLHEGGHFLPAKLFGTRVEKFYLFFDPGFSLFKFQKGETEYGIGWLPFGGYVKISGMIDESMDTEQMEGPPQPWEFRSKPAWQRLVIMLGGVTVNFILGFIIFAGMLWTWGLEYLPSEKAEFGIHPDSIGLELGLMEGDKILQIGDIPFEKFNPNLFRKELIVNDARNVKVERNGRTETITLPSNAADLVSSRDTRGFGIFDIRFPTVVHKSRNGSPAEKAGIIAGDKIIKVNGTSTPFFQDMAKILNNNKGKPTTVTVVRDNVEKDIDLTLTEHGKLGIELVHYFKIFGSKTEEFTFLESIPEGIKMGWGTLTDQAKAIGQMITNKISAKDNLGSVFTIAKAFGTEWNWRSFWNLTATLSLVLAFMNLLPIPALDGGHVMFLLYEVISGRKPNDKIVEYATIAGFFLLVGFMIFILSLDFWNSFLR